LNIVIFFIVGLLTSLLFPPYFFLPLGFIIFPYICFFIEKNKYNLKKIILFKYIFSYSFALFLSLLFWIQNPFYVFEETKNLFFISILLIILLSLIFSLVFILILSFNNFVPTLFLVPLVFIVFEYIISIIFYGFPWITFSLIFSNFDYFSVIIKNFGTLISSYIAIQLYCVPYILFTKENFKFSYLYYSILIILPLVIVIFFNSIFVDTKNNINRKIKIEIFQLNHEILNTTLVSQIRLNKIIDYISSSDADILIFGENNYPYIIKDEEIEFIKNLLKKNQILIIGGTRIDKDNYFNTLLHINNKNFFYFDKKILVPFGEFLPFRQSLSFLEPISGLLDFSEGTKKRLMKINNDISYIPVICYEIIFYWKIINNLNYDSDFIVNITNDVWFGNILGPYQHFYLTKLRAAEFNKTIVRVSNNGISGVIDENGKVLIRTTLNTNQVVKYNLNIKNNKNFYKSHNYLNIYFIIIFLLLIVFTLKKNKSVKHNNKLFGRTRGRSSKKTSLAQYLKIIKKYKIQEFNENSNYILDIGTGYGETSIYLSKKNKDKNIISCEKYIDGNLNLIKKIELENITNIKIHPGNVYEILNKLGNKKCFDSIWIFFPDPWPKKKHFKRRLITFNFLKKLHNYLKSRGKIYIVTDSPSYTKQILNSIYQASVFYNWTNQNEAHFILKDYFDFETKFYKKAIISGRQPILLILKKI